MQSQFEKILNLVRRTGDKMVVVDQNDPGEGYVVMDLKEYKELIEDKKPWLEEDLEDDSDESLNEPWQEDNFYHQDDTEDSEDSEDSDDEENEEYSNIFDTPEVDNNDDFSVENSDYSDFEPESQGELDNNEEYGNIEYTENKGQNVRKSSRWRISEDVKNTRENPSPNSHFPEEEDDRYYLETI